MNIYLLRQLNHPANKAEYDVNYGHVVFARTSEEARHLASEIRGDEGPECWTNPKRSCCEMIGVSALYDTPQVLLSDFRAG